MASSDELASKLSYQPKMNILASLYWLLQTIRNKNVSNPTIDPRNFAFAYKGSVYRNLV